MRTVGRSPKIFSQVARYRTRRIMWISLSWTLVDLLLYIRNVSQGDDIDYPFHESSPWAFLLRSGIVWLTSIPMTWLLLQEVQVISRHRAMLAGWIGKTISLLSIAYAGVSLAFAIHFLMIKQAGLEATLAAYRNYFFHTSLAADSLVFWLVMILSAQIIVEIDQKYSPGVFWEILTGKYLKPRNEKRIIMFLDLKDSTPIAEQLGHEKYFLFIRDFVYAVSKAILENNGMIYQYVGDEVVVTWPYKRENVLKSLNTVVESRKEIQRRSDSFRRDYDGLVPEFRVGMHAGNVTIGEIGIIKKDLAISGEAMNIAARIRSACNELNHKFLVSEEYFDTGILKSWQGENLGVVSLKGLDESMQLFALRI